MPQILYSGENYAKPIRSEGRALQALGQFTQQHQQRKEADLARSRQDRDKMAEMMKLDPVYATHIKLQERIADIGDAHMDDMASYNKGIDGPPNSKDWMYIQQKQSQSMSEMMQIKALDGRMTEASKLYNATPWMFDEDEYKASMKYAETNLAMPPQGFLFKRLENPLIKGSALMGEMTKGLELQESVVETHTGPAQKHVETTSYYDTDATADELINMTRTVDGQESDVQGWFTKMVSADPSEFNHYMDLADGDEELAAQMWYSTEMQKLNPFYNKSNPNKTYDTKSRTGYRAPKGSGSGSGGDDDEVYYGISKDNMSLGTTDGRSEDVRFEKGVSAGPLGKQDAIVFANETIGSSDKIELPIDVFGNTLEGLDLQGKTHLRVVPKFGAKGRISFNIVDKLRKRVEVASFQDVPKDKRSKSSYIYDKEGNPTGGKYYYEDVTDISAVANADDVLPNLNPHYKGQLIDFWNYHMKGGKPQEEPAKQAAEENKVDKWNNRY